MLVTSSTKQVVTELISGHQIASGRAANSPYPAGSIELQIPFFKDLGLNLAKCFSGTLNLSIKPHRFEWIEPDFQFKDVAWIDGFPPETFWFAECSVHFLDKAYSAWIYYPHPATKTQHFHSDHVLEIIAENIPGIAYGDEVVLEYDPKKIRLY